MSPFFTSERQSNLTVVTFQTATLMNAMELERIGTALMQLVDEGAHRLLLDFAKVEYLSSQAIGIVLGLNKRVMQQKGRLVLCAVGPKLMDLLKITRLDKILTIRPTRQEGLAAAAK